MTAITNLITWLNDNWSALVVVIGLAIALYRKISSYLKKSNTEKVAIAKRQLEEIMLKLVADAEEDYEIYHKAGEIKRAEVLNIIYDKFPILANVMPQEQLIEWLDSQIDAALAVLREILNEHNEPEEVEEVTYVNNEGDLQQVEVAEEE